MTVQLTTEQVWQAIEKELFAVIGMVTAQYEARTVGVMYAVRGRRLYIGTGKDTWKTRHITANSHVSVTIPIAKRIPLLPWFKIPAATITFSGTAHVLEAEETPTELLQAVFRDLANNEQFLSGTCLIEVTPEREFITYGIGIPLMQMRYPEKARGRASVGVTQGNNEAYPQPMAPNA